MVDPIRGGGFGRGLPIARTLLPKTFIRSVVSISLFWSECAQRILTQFVIRGLGEPEDVPQTLKNIFGPSLKMHGGEKAFFPNDLQEIAEKAFFLFPGHLVVNHGPGRLYIVDLEV